jgi:glutathione S-transferase
MLTLYQFTFSHFCGKARWALDYKGLRYTPRNLLPGPHRRVVLRLARKSSVPLLIDNGEIIQGSTEIIDHLDSRYPEHPLTPADRSLAKESREWEEYLDAEVGLPLRLWGYYHLLPDSRLALRVMLRGAPWNARLYYPLIFPRVRERMSRFLHINADSARQAEQRAMTALARLDDTIATRPYLVGGQFTRADLTACSLLAMLCPPEDSQHTVALPKAMADLIDGHRSRPYARWVRQVYAKHRKAGDATGRAAA